MNDIYSFYKLISKFNVEIPIIQRDYAQGRKNAKATDVRKSIVNNMIKAVVAEDQSLTFDFVYGRICNNKFIPFDGQQRLTTLFLFHKYVFEKCYETSQCPHRFDCVCKDILHRFTYVTRKSSREFCKSLVNNNIIPNNDDKISENIKNQSWFFPDWIKDPTIVGMMVMLDEIHHQMSNVENLDIKKIAEKLTNGCNCPITFHFVDMGENNLPDETYIKMNARGKILTPFENFKTSLQQYFEEKNQQALLNNFKNNIDGRWLDLFWKEHNKDKSEKEVPDTLMMSFFNRHFMNVWVCWFKKNSKKGKELEELFAEGKNRQDELDDFNKRIREEMPLFPSKDDFVAFELYRFVMDNCGVEQCVNPIFNIFDKLCEEDNNVEVDCQAVLNRNDNTGKKWDLFQRDADSGLKYRAAFYGLLKYFENNDPKIPTLAQWMRIVWNIVENYVEDEDSYISSLQIFDSMAEVSFDIRQLEISYQGPAKDQVNEEIAKAKMIFDDSGNLSRYTGINKKEDGSEYQNWEEIIIEAEQFAFFKGAIRFLFTDPDGKVKWNDFDQKYSKARKYFKLYNGHKTIDKDPYNFNVLKFFISRCVSGDELKAITYDVRPTTWKNNLLEEKLQKVVHHFLSDADIDLFLNGRTCGRCNSCGWFRIPDKDETWRKVQLELADTSLLNNIANNCLLVNKWGQICLRPKYAQENRTYIINNVRNQFLSQLIKNEKVESKNKMSDCDFFWGYDINFKYKGCNFEWNTDEKIYLKKDNERMRDSNGEWIFIESKDVDSADTLIRLLDEMIKK